MKDSGSSSQYHFRNIKHEQLPYQGNCGISLRRL